MCCFKGYSRRKGRRPHLKLWRSDVQYWHWALKQNVNQQSWRVTHSSSTRTVGLPENVQSRVQICCTYPAMWLTACGALCTPNSQTLSQGNIVKTWHHFHITLTYTHIVSVHKRRQKCREVYTYWLALYNNIIHNNEQYDDASFSTITLRWASIDRKQIKWKTPWSSPNTEGNSQ